MKKSYLIMLLTIVCCFLNQYVSAQGFESIWKHTWPSLEIEQTATYTGLRNSNLDMDGDNMPELVAFRKGEDKVVIRMSSGQTSNLSLNYETIEGFVDYKFGGFFKFFDTDNSLKQMLMVKRDGQNIIGILVGVIGEEEVDFNTPIPSTINDSESRILRIKDYNGNGFEEIKVTYISTDELFEWVR